MTVTGIPVTVRRVAVRIGLVAAVTTMAYVAGVIPAPAGVAVDHCYVTYDRLERQHSRCVGHWSRLGLATSGPVRGVPVSTQWQVLTTDPDENYEWEVTVPETSRHHTAFTVLGMAWIVPWPMQGLLTALTVMAVGYLTRATARRLRRRPADSPDSRPRPG